MPSGGRTKHKVNAWKSITRDKFILNSIQGCKINFVAPPFQDKLPHDLNYSSLEKSELCKKVAELIKDKVIEECDFQEGDYLNTVFLRKKKEVPGEPQKFRFILNMKKLNKQFVEKIKHKIESLKTCLNLMEPNCYMASIDLKNAFHTIPIDPSFSKFLKFKFDNKVFKFLVLPMGFRDSPRLFCKILKPVLAFLRKKRLIICLYIDDFYLQGRTLQECLDNVTKTMKLLKKLGFDISEKSMLAPSQTMQHLGFVLNSKDMNVSLSSEKQNKIKVLILHALNKNTISVQELASIIGSLIASFPAVEYGMAFHRNLEFLKIDALAKKYNFAQKVTLNDACREELNWWLCEGLFMTTPISHGNPDIIIQTDSSGFAWGAVRIGGNRTQGLWSEEELEWDINVKETKACLLGVQALYGQASNCHVQVQTDNTTALSYINNMGGVKVKLCNNIAKELIVWCKARGIWVSASYIPGRNNTEADSLSRKINDNLEWKLDKSSFEYICNKFGTPDIDLFASRANHQLPRYMSFYPDAGAEAINAFSQKWDSFAYLFPPFNLIPRVLRKIQEDKARVVLVVPRLQGAAWFPRLSQMAEKKPLLLRKSEVLLSLPHKPNATHPLLPKMRLTAWLLSGKG